MSTLEQSKTVTQSGASNLATRVVVFALVLSVHVAVISVWSSQPDANAATHHELSVSFALAAQAPQPAIAQPRKSSVPTLPASKKIAEQATVAPAEKPVTVAAPSIATAAPSIATAAPAVADTEPDYKAAYLNNPPPVYPLIARRNGLQGRVLLSVEVLADGVCGQINIHKSSGYAMLDNAALQTVKSWRFLPARQAGHTVDKWFMIPVQFSLKDNAA